MLFKLNQRPVEFTSSNVKLHRARERGAGRVAARVGGVRTEREREMGSWYWRKKGSRERHDKNVKLQRGRSRD